MSTTWCHLNCFLNMHCHVASGVPNIPVIVMHSVYRVFNPNHGTETEMIRPKYKAWSTKSVKPVVHQRLGQEDSMDGLHHCSPIKRLKMKYHQLFHMMDTTDRNKWATLRMAIWNLCILSGFTKKTICHTKWWTKDQDRTHHFSECLMITNCQCCKGQLYSFK
jgi:hypothetical protein